MNESLLLSEYPLFEPGLLQAIIHQGEQRTFSSDEILIRKGQYIRSTILVLSGLIKVYREDDEGNEFLMYYLRPGEACALSLVCAARQETSPVLAKTDMQTEAILIPVSVMSDWMSAYKTWYQFVIETYRTRFDEVLLTLDSVAFRSMDERLEFYLKRSCAVSGKTTIEISHQQIAQELNSSREVISRLLKKMEQRGWVRLHRNAIEVVTLSA